jgi:hypothetical protein
MTKKLAIYFCLIVGSFFLGMKWNQFQYEDTCLDMGGGKNPGNHPICVIEGHLKTDKNSAK